MSALLYWTKHEQTNKTHKHEAKHTHTMKTIKKLCIKLVLVEDNPIFV